MRKEIQTLKNERQKSNSASAEIEIILREAGKPLHVREITEELHRRGFSIAFQSVSATLQVAAKKRSKYKRVGPATFTLREKKQRNSYSR